MDGGAAGLNGRNHATNGDLSGPPAAFSGHPQGVTVTRVVGMFGNHMLLLAPSEVRLAQTENKTVWLSTDRGRLRSPERTLDRVEEKLAPHGFLRVHRHCLVNLHRVQEIAPVFRGGLVLIVDGAEHETVPVSRRHVADLRRALDL